MLRLFASFAACAAVLAAAPAFAQAPPPPQLPPPPPPPPNLQPPPSLPPPPPPTSGPGPSRPPAGRRPPAYGAPRGRAPSGPVTVYVSPDAPRADDAHVDRVMLASTAETHPEGTFFLSDYDLAAAQIGYAFTDRAQLAVSFAPSIFVRQPYFADVTLKANVHRGETLHAALLVGFDALAFPGRPEQNLLGARAGGVAQICFELACRSSVSLGGNVLFSNRTSEVVPFLFSAGLVVYLSPLVKLLAEPSWSAVLGHGALDGPRGFLFGYGVRLSQHDWGVDLGFVKPFDPNDEGPIAPGYPFVAATWRSSR
jgi:hypothetical protein